MSYTPERRQLHGLSVGIAELYGKPHLHAVYTGSGIGSHRVDDGAMCAICRRPATNAHHVPPRSKGTFTLTAPDGSSWVLRPALFALCGSGTTGCHNGFHGAARFVPEWVWDSDADAEMWWSGEILRCVGPHDEAIYGYGSWAIHDRIMETSYRFRGGD